MQHPIEPIKRLALLGGESSGKTTLARSLAHALGTVWVPEYGRQRWEALRTTLTVDELVHVAQVQVQWETEHLAQAHAYLICDTTPLITLQYCLHDHGEAPAELQRLARRAYDVTVLCLPDFSFVQDGCRRDNTFRQQQHHWTLERLAEMGVVPLQVHGSVADRLSQVMAHVSSLSASAPPVVLTA
jgi:HTH-type transcriptional regulator, transcriptional repressor of NAD biosynthesis genes